MCASWITEEGMLVRNKEGSQLEESVFEWISTNKEKLAWKEKVDDELEKK